MPIVKNLYSSIAQGNSLAPHGAIFAGLPRQSKEYGINAANRNES